MEIPSYEEMDEAFLRDAESTAEPRLIFCLQRRIKYLSADYHHLAYQHEYAATDAKEMERALKRIVRDGEGMSVLWAIECLKHVRNERKERRDPACTNS